MTNVLPPEMQDYLYRVLEYTVKTFSREELESGSVTMEVAMRSYNDAHIAFCNKVLNSPEVIDELCQDMYRILRNKNGAK